MPAKKRIAALAALALIGIATGVAAERAIVGRPRRADPDRDEPFGTLRNEGFGVRAGDGVMLHVEIEEPLNAPDDGLTIIFSHGYSLNQDCWHYQRRDLRGLGRLVFWDQRSHGKSGRSSAANSTIDQLGYDLGDVIDAVSNGGPVILVGHSMGGMTTMSVAAHRPDLFGDDGPVKGVALIGTSAGSMSELSFGLPASVGRLAHQALPRLLNAAVSRAEMIEARRANSSDIAEVITRYLSFGSDVSPSMSKFCSQMINGTSIDVVAEFLPTFDTHDKAEALAAFASTDSLVMVGTKDMLTPLRYSNDIIRLMPHAESVLLPGIGHMLMLEAYNEVNYELRELAARVRSRLASAAAAGSSHATDFVI